MYPCSYMWYTVTSTTGNWPVKFLNSVEVKPRKKEKKLLGEPMQCRDDKYGIISARIGDLTGSSISSQFYKTWYQ